MVIATVTSIASAIEIGESYTYTFNMSFTGNAVVQMPTLTDYDLAAGRNWKHYATDVGGDKRTLGECVNLVPTARGQFQSFTLSEISAGVYNIGFEYATRKDGGTGNVYLAPASDAANATADKYLLGLIDYYSENPTTVAPKKDGSVSLGSITIPASGEYILTFKNVDKNSNASGLAMNPAKLTLTKTANTFIEYTYKLGQANDVGGLVQVPTVTDYVAKGGTNGEWKYYGMCDGLSVLQEANSRTFEINQSYGAFVSISFNAVGQYAQLMLKVPKKNAYFEPELTLHAGANSTKTKVYIAPKSAKNPRAKEYLRGYLSAKDMTCELSGFMTDANETEYILTFENVSAGNGNDIRFKSLVLSEKDATEVRSVNEEYAFNFVHATAGIGIPTLDTYEKTLRNWKYCNMESSLKATYDAGGTAARTLAGCLNIVPGNANGQWLSLTLDNISKGTYDITFDYATHKNGGIGDVYLAPASVSESARTNAEYKIGTIDYYETDAAYKTGYSAKLLKTTLKEDGDYVITFKHTGKKNPSAAGYQMNPAKLRLFETKADTPSGTVANELASVSVLSEVGGSVEVDGSYNVIDNVAIGTKIKTTATANDGYTFAYWRNAAGKHLSSNVTETFVINTNTAIIAVFDKIANPDDTEAPVYFYNENGSLLDSKKVAKGTSFADAKIENPTLTGYVFDKWSISDTAVINTLTRAVALYTDSDETYTISVGANAVVSNKKYGELVTVTSSDNNFSYWTIDGNIISYDKSFTFRVYGNVTLTEVCEGAKKAQPTVALDVIDDNYFIGYTVPAGYTKIEAGILFGNGFTPTVGSFYAKAAEKTGSGQFTAKAADSSATVARGYIIFKSIDGSIRVIYAD